MDHLAVKTWVIFYLLSFAGLLWAAFLSSQGIQLGVSLVLDILVVGVNSAIVLNEVKRHIAKKEKIRSILASTGTGIIPPLEKTR